MSVRIKINKKNTLNPDGTYKIELICLPTTTGVDTGIFVFQVKPGQDPEFNHVANAADIAGLPAITPALGVAFYRLSSVAFTYKSAYEVADLETRMFDDISALQQNLDQIALSYAADKTFEFTAGLITDITP